MGEPRLDRPWMPGYGVPDNNDDVLPWSWAVERINTARTHFICSTRPDGRPHSMPCWGVWCNDRYAFSTAITSVKSKNLLKNPAVAVTFEVGLDAFVLEGTAVVTQLDEIPDFTATYKKQYEQTIDQGPVWSVIPRQAFAFIADDTFSKTATAWRWD